ncbi:MAG: trypsin-like peptidase domain-containing protein [Calditrichaeota bacterium]|nr:trypsin-like peptidase domain-containing protein [Calditrichota bacterium]MCB9365765.1 trypsin-like peptidase domain-containing protein [Calditrichota bacterium]
MNTLSRLWLSVILLLFASGYVLSFAQTKNAKSEPLVLNNEAIENNSQTDEFDAWREWFRAHEQDAESNPLPEWTPPALETLGEQEVAMHDPLTGETQVGTLRELFPNSFDANGQFIPYIESRADEPNALDAFSIGEIIEDPSVSPWKVNCKLLISANGGVGHGSGVLIDGQHVLTAGHCVYNIDLDEWVDMIEVIPAYDEGVRPYGTAYSSGFLAWTGWTVAHSWDWDLAVVKLNRPVGAITGWFPTTYTTNDTFYRENTFHSTGYPVTSPFYGTRLNYRYGPFDSTSTNILYELDTTHYGGMSGGGVYYRQSLFTRTVHAVASHGYGGYGGFNRITSTKNSGIISYIYGNLNPVLDLGVYGCTVNPDQYVTGDSLGTPFFYLYNKSYDSLMNVDLTVRLYLSTNNVISTSDYLLSTTVFQDVYLAPRETQRMDWPYRPALPWTYNNHWYWVGVVLMYTDAVSSNNASSYDDADSIYIALSAPMRAHSPTPYNGQQSVVSDTLRWIAGTGATSHNVYYGENTQPNFRLNQTGTSYIPPVFWPGHTYYWRIDEVNSAGTTTGDLWFFTTQYPDPPEPATNPYPGNGATNIPVDVVCTWDAGGGYTEEFDVYFGTSNPPPFVQTQVLQTYDPPGNLLNNQVYYWKIVARNPSGEIGSSLWSFTTVPLPPGPPTTPSPADGATGVLVGANLLWTQGARTVTEDLFFGPTNPPPYIGRENYGGFYNPPGDLQTSTTYYWRVQEVNSGGLTLGPMWSFTTSSAAVPPGMPSNPYPADNATGVSPYTSFAFTPGSNSTYHELWFYVWDDYYLFWGGTTPFVPDTVFGPLDPNTYYSWRIKEFNGPLSTMGPPWYFTTGTAIPSDPPEDLTLQIEQNAFGSFAVLRWLPSPNGPFYRIYRSEDPGFIPGPSNYVTTVTDTMWADHTVFASPAAMKFYIVTAHP